MDKYPIIETLPENILKNIFNYLVDLNSSKTPQEIIENILEMKKEFGSYPLGAVKISNSEWAIVDTSGNVYFKLNK